MSDCLEKLLMEQLKKYPALQLQDCIKLIYQKEFGGEHLWKDARCPFSRILSFLQEEKTSVGVDKSVPLYEAIGDSFCRLNLLPLDNSAKTLETLARLFLKSSELPLEEADQRKTAFSQSLTLLLSLIDRGLLPYAPDKAREFLARYRKEGCPPLHHSEQYREAYHPAYRLLTLDYGRFFPLFAAIDQLLSEKKQIVIAIDGRCAAGKSTLAALLARSYDCNVVQMDDFFLPGELRTPERLNSAGGNIHYERFLEEVFPSLVSLPTAASDFSSFYRIFDCHSMSYKAERGTILSKPLTVVEGSYSMRQEFRSAYALTVFLDISDELQKERLLARNGKEAWTLFETKWIPMENHYFSCLEIPNHCDFIFKAD